MSKRTIEEVEAEAIANGRMTKSKRSKREEKERKAKAEQTASAIGVNGVTGPEEVKAEGGEKQKEKKKKNEKRLDRDGDKEKKKQGRMENREKHGKEDGENNTDSVGEVKQTTGKKGKKSKKEKKRKKITGEQKEAMASDAMEDVPASAASYVESSTLSALPASEIAGFLRDNLVSIQDPLATNLRPIVAFEHLPPHPFVLTSYARPTPVQAATWPFTLSGHDVIGVAETGSGKTMAFAVPAIRHILAARERAGGKKKSLGICVVVVSPTRELAMQIYDVIAPHAAAVCLYGGVPKDSQRADLRRANIIVATPGRLNDFIFEGAADLANASFVVLDEADRMLDKGFEDDVRRILSTCAPSDRRQTLMFTATWPPSVRELAASFMRPRAVRVTIGDRDDLRANRSITQIVEVMEPDSRHKEQRLLELVRTLRTGKHSNDRILVFALYQKEAVRIEGFLRRAGIAVAGIHGALSQTVRTSALAAFRSGNTPTLVATDVAARGLDIPAVRAVINVTFPLTVEDYVHRIGRTGRAGEQGVAFTFFTSAEKTLAGGLVNVLKGAGQEVPEELVKFGTAVKKKEHSAYGAFYRDIEGAKKPTKITFDD